MNKMKMFLENLELSEGDESIRFPQMKKRRPEGLESTEPEAAALDYKSLQSFVAGVSKQRQEDVLNSLLLAQRVATKSAPDDSQIMEWYKKYFEILGGIGWLIEGGDFMVFNSRSSIFEIDKAILEILGAAITGNQLAVLSKTIESFKTLGESDKRFLAFEKNTHTLQSGSFQLGVASEENDTLSISGSAFILNTGTKVTNILFFNSNRDTTEFKFRKIKATLNDEVFKEGRDLIKERLGDVRSFIAELEI